MTNAEMVAKAIEFLDKYAVYGWREKINLDRLDLDSGSRCVLGQIYGDYHSTGASNLRTNSEAGEFFKLSNAFNDNTYLGEWKIALSNPAGIAVGQEWKSNGNGSASVYKIVALYEAEGAQYVGYRSARYGASSNHSTIKVEQFIKDCSRVVEPPKPKYVPGRFYTNDAEVVVLLCESKDKFYRLNKAKDKVGYVNGGAGWGSADYYEENFGPLKEIRLGSDGKTFSGKLDS